MIAIPMHRHPLLHHRPLIGPNQCLGRPPRQRRRQQPPRQCQGPLPTTPQHNTNTTTNNHHQQVVSLHGPHPQWQHYLVIRPCNLVSYVFNNNRMEVIHGNKRLLYPYRRCPERVVVPITTRTRRHQHRRIVLVVTIVVVIPMLRHDDACDNK